MLLGGPDISQGTAALYISVRQKDKNIIFNTFVEEGEVWGKEEKKKKIINAVNKAVFFKDLTHFTTILWSRLIMVF